MRWHLGPTLDLTDLESDEFAIAHPPLGWAIYRESLQMDQPLNGHCPNCDSANIRHHGPRWWCESCLERELAVEEQSDDA